MIAFDPDELLDLLREQAERYRVMARLDRGAIVAAIAHAEALAGGRSEDEPGAVFYAFGQRSRAFGRAAEFFVPILAHAQAAAAGLELDAADVALSIHRLRLLRGEIEWEELRDWFAARLTPIRLRP